MNFTCTPLFLHPNIHVSSSRCFSFSSSLYSSFHYETGGAESGLPAFSLFYTQLSSSNSFLLSQYSNLVRLFSYSSKQYAPSFSSITCLQSFSVKEISKRFFFVFSQVVGTIVTYELVLFQFSHGQNVAPAINEGNRTANY